MVSLSLGDIAARLGGELIGSATNQIDRIGPLEDATASTISFLSNPRYTAQLAGSRAACVIVAPAAKDAAVQRGAAIVTPDPYLYYAKLTQWWAELSRPRAAGGIHPSAVVDASARVAPGATVGPLAVIEAGAVVGEGAVIGAHCFLGEGVVVGEHTRLAARVTFYAGCSIGARGLVHSGAVIGADGFGFAPTQGRWEKIEQLGGVRIGDDVEIGANTCIDRGALGDTVIGDGVKMDNQIQIGHNVRIGEHTIMPACTGVAGSATIGAHCGIGGGAMIHGHISICDGTQIGAGSMVRKSITQPGVYSGTFPLDDNAKWEKNAATLLQLHSLRDRIRALEKNKP